MTSVPSDAPDDYAALRDVQKKEVSQGRDCLFLVHIHKWMKQSNGRMPSKLLQIVIYVIFTHTINLADLLALYCIFEL